MVQYSTGAAEPAKAFGALADPTRMAVLTRLSQGSATISELAEPAEISLTGMNKHVRVLEEAGLVTTEKVGRTRVCRARPEGFVGAQVWIDTYQQMLEQRLDRFGEMLERQAENSNEKGKS